MAVRTALVVTLVVAVVVAIGACSGCGAPAELAAPDLGAGVGADLATAPADLAAADAGDGGAADGGAAFAPAPHVPWPVLQNQGGPVLKDPALVALVPANHALAAELGAFTASVPSSRWWSAVSAESGLGTLTAETHTTAAWTGAFDDGGVSSYVQAAITAGTIPKPNGHRLYLLFVPDAVTGQCVGQLGYHDTWPKGGQSPGDVLAVVEWCPPDPLVPAQEDELTWTASHEIAEGSTNPQFGSAPAWVMATPASEPWTESPWFSVVGEVGDLCDSSFELEGGFLYERVWSVSAAAQGGDPCIPSVSASYWDVSNVSTPGWIEVKPGATVDVPLTGWSSAPAPPWWQLGTYVTRSSSGFSGASVSITSPRSGWFGSCPHLPIADDAGAAGTVTLHVSVPAAAKSGDWAVAEIDSFRQNGPGCSAARGGDARHYWFVGVYVP